MSLSWFKDSAAFFEWKHNLQLGLQLMNLCEKLLLLLPVFKLLESVKNNFLFYQTQEKKRWTWRRLPDYKIVSSTAEQLIVVFIKFEFLD